METKLKDTLENIQEWARANRDSKWPLMTTRVMPEPIIESIAKIPGLLEEYEVATTGEYGRDIFRDPNRADYRGIRYPALPLVGMIESNLLISNPKDKTSIQIGGASPNESWIARNCTGQLDDNEKECRPAIRIISEDEKIDTLWISQPRIYRPNVSSIFRAIITNVHYNELNKKQDELATK